MSDNLTDTCLNCGARVESTLGLGPMYFIPDTGYEQLRGVFLNLFDYYHCRACGKVINFRPSVFLGIDQWKQCIYVTGDWFAASPPDLQSRFLNDVLGKDARVEAFASMDQLRVEYAKRIVSMVERINSMVQLMAQWESFKEAFEKDWRAFTSKHFVAAALVITTPLPGVTVSFPNTVQESVNFIAKFQSLVWMALCSSWSGQLKEDQTLEDSLNSYFEPNTALNVAVADFLEFTETPPSDWHIGTLFCIEAMRATLYAWSNKPNPQVRKWTEMFVEQEITRLSLGDNATPLLKAMEISPERARATIPYEELFDEGLRRCAKNFHLRTQMGEIGKKLGYPNLDEELLSAFRFQPTTKALSAEKVLTLIRDMWKGVDPETAAANDTAIQTIVLLRLASKSVELLGDAPSCDSMVALADGLKQMLGADDPETRARLDQWLCSHLHRRNMPQAVLERIGDKARPWEQDISLGARVGLWIERSNALRMCGRVPEALTIVEAVIADIAAANETIPAELRRNLGILYRESGRYEEALEIFLKLLPESPRNLDLLNSIVTTYISVGQSKEMMFYLEAMVPLATGPYASRRPAIIANLAAAKAFSGKHEEALALLREVKVDSTDDIDALLACAGGWCTFLTCVKELEEEDRQTVTNLIAKLKVLSHDANEAGNINLGISINRSLAILLDLFGHDEPNIYWELVDAAAREFEGSPDPLATLALARNAWDDELYEKFRNHLIELPSAISKRFGQGQDASLRSSSLSNLSMISHVVAERAFRNGSLADVRLIAEVTRDMLGRMSAASISQKMPSSGFVVPNADVIAKLGGPTAVFEWVQSDLRLCGLATFIAMDGTVIESFINLPEIDLDALAERITQRLSLWRPGRIGSPLDLHDWQIFESWLTSELEGRLPDGGRLVVIEHETIADLQWHVAAAPRWRVSYAPSWSSLLSAQPATIQSKNGPIGLVMVPKYSESTHNLEALQRSVSATIQFAKQSNLKIQLAVGEACDRDALVGVLEKTKVVKVLCHGFVDPDTDIVALMVACEGELPLGNSVAANTSIGRQHRFDWRDCQQLKSAPLVLFSGACRSGHSHHAGFGERLGLFSTLRRAGTRSVVAPRWDINPEIVLPVLDNAMERYLSNGTTLGEALNTACSEAGSVLPRWQAWALALEGDWK